MPVAVNRHNASHHSTALTVPPAERRGGMSTTATTEYGVVATSPIGNGHVVSLRAENPTRNINDHSHTFCDRAQGASTGREADPDIEDGVSPCRAIGHQPVTTASQRRMQCRS